MVCCQWLIVCFFLEQYPGRMEYKLPNSLAYRNIAPGQVNISWAYPHYIAERVSGATVLYSDDERRNYDQWQKINIVGGEQVSMRIFQLRIQFRNRLH